jgi:hypothetical protein
MSVILIELAAHVEYLNQRSLISSAIFTVVAISYLSNITLNNCFNSFFHCFTLVHLYSHMLPQNCKSSGKIELKITLPTVVFKDSHLNFKTILSFSTKSPFPNALRTSSIDSKYQTIGAFSAHSVSESKSGYLLSKQSVK